MLLDGPETMVPFEFSKVQFVVCSSRVVLTLLTLCRYKVTLFELPGYIGGHVSVLFYSNLMFSYDCCRS